MVNNLTGTMIWPDFLSALEPNLAIICVCLPMLGNLRSRCIASRRGGSKLTPSTQGSTGGLATGGSKFNRLRSGSHGPNKTVDEFHLKSIYAPDTEVYHHSSVATATQDGDGVGAGKDSDSEVALKPRSLSDEEEGRLEQRNSRVIKVHQKWTISRE
jgi:hypothetical protein